MFEKVNDTFLYFAYGSNLLKKRIHINNPTAVFLGIGRLENHHLDFIKYSEHWRGTSATICRTYQQSVNPPKREDGEQLPIERRPCITYLECIVDGAKECELPPSYIDELTKIPHNGQVASAKLIEKLNRDNYRLHFIKYSTFWGGPTATLVPTANAHVWGVIWRVHEEDSVEINKYYIRYVKALTPYMGSFTCRAYTQKVIPLPMGDNDPIPVERWPSWTYKEIMIYGAKEHGMPGYYIRNLKKMKHNGEEGALRTVCLLIRYGRNAPC
ncbi:Gamma-glutamyl cyclotransferase-like venom protein isoform 1, partial [Operophtera brumata]